ncbi:hypothetical protein [Dactylosporangium darangshiense]|uniref:hypothetical protein n=1 Tax=Dactylosporangium darangshiense TaxID=579108 RepID=UPI0031EFB968
MGFVSSSGRRASTRGMRGTRDSSMPNSSRSARRRASSASPYSALANSRTRGVRRVEGVQDQAAAAHVDAEEAALLDVGQPPRAEPRRLVPRCGAAQVGQVRRDPAGGCGQRRVARAQPGVGTANHLLAHTVALVDRQVRIEGGEVHAAAGPARVEQQHVDTEACLGPGRRGVTGLVEPDDALDQALRARSADVFLGHALARGREERQPFDAAASVQGFGGTPGIPAIPQEPVRVTLIDLGGSGGPRALP